MRRLTAALTAVLAGALLWSGSACAGPRPEPGAWPYASTETKVGVLVDWADWQGNMSSGAAGGDLVQSLVTSGRCRSLYMYVLSDGHTICPVEGSSLPNVGVAAGITALAEFVAWVKAQGVSCYAVLDLLEWHRAGSSLPDPVQGGLVAARETLCGGGEAPGSTYVSPFDRRVRQELELLIDAFSSAPLGFDGILLDTHLPRESLLGGSVATALAYQGATGGRVDEIVAPAVSEEEGQALSRFLRWRRSAIAGLVGDLARRAQKRPDLRVGLVSAVEASGGPGADYSLLDALPSLLRSAPHTVVLLSGDWGEANTREDLRYYRVAAPTMMRSCAVMRPVLTDRSLASAADLIDQAGPTDEVVVRVTPETRDKPVLEWVGSIPVPSPSRATEALSFIIGDLPHGPVSLSLTAVTPRSALEEVVRVLRAARPDFALDLSPQMTRRVDRLTQQVSADLTGVPASQALAWLCVQLGAFPTESQSGGWRLIEASDPGRLLGDALRAAGRPDEAVELYDDALARGADVPDALRAKGDIQLWTKWAFDPAIATYERLLAEGVRTPSLLASVGLCCACIRGSGRRNGCSTASRPRPGSRRRRAPRVKSTI